jgi:hypothetical protein
LLSKGNEVVIEEPADGFSMRLIPDFPLLLLVVQEALIHLMVAEMTKGGYAVVMSL